MKSYKVILTQTALKDVASISHYVRYVLGAPKSAQTIVRNIMIACNLLVNFPNRFPVVEEFTYSKFEVRQCPVRNYTVLYCVDENKNLVTVLRVVYKKMNLEQLELNDSEQ